MFFKLSICLLFISILCSCSSVKKSNNKLTTPVPNQFKSKTKVNPIAHFSIVSFFGNSYYVKIKNKTLNYSVVSRGVKEKKSINLSSRDIIELEKKFNELKVNTWKSKYSITDVVDGMLWQIKYHSENMNINSEGYGSYPKKLKELTNYISKSLLKGSKFE